MHQVACHASGVVARYSGLFKIVAEDGNHAESFNRLQIVHDLAGAFARVFGLKFRGSGSSVNEGVVEDLFLRVAIERANMVGGGQPEALVGLGHQVAYVDPGSWRFDNRLRDATHQQVRNQAGKKRSRTDGDQVSVGNCLQGLRHGSDVGWDEKQFPNASLAGSDVGFSANAGAVFHERFEFNVRRCCRIDVAAGEKNVGRETNGFGKV